MKKINDLKIFKSFATEGKPNLDQQAIQNMVRQVLLDMVSDKQRQILEVVNYHSLDPKHQNDGKMQGLLEYLIFDALSETNTFRTEDRFYAKIFLYNLKKYTGMSNLELFKKEIEAINEKWEGVASIKITSIASGSPNISFELI